MDQLKITKNMFLTLIIAGVVLLALFVGVIFQIIRIKDLQRQNKQLQQRVEQLEGETSTAHPQFDGYDIILN